MIECETAPAATSPPRHDRVFAGFWTARAVSLLGDGVASTALVLLVGGRDGPGGVAVLLLATAVPRFFGPLAGALADRYESRRLLLAAEAAQAVLWTAAAVLLPGLSVLIPLVLAATACATVTVNAGRIIVVRALPEADLPKANAWLGLAFNLRILGGPLLGGLATELFGARVALAANVATFVVGAVVLARLPRFEPARRGAAGMAGLFADTRAGLAFARRDPLVRGVSLLLLGGVMFGSLDNVALVFLARDDLHASAFGYGALAAAFGAAMIAVSLWLTRGAGRFSAESLFLGGWVAAGAGLVLTGIAPLLGLAMAAQVVAGAGNGAASIGEEVLLQRGVPAAMLGRMGGLLSSAAFLGSVVAYAVGGLLVAVLSPRPVFVIAGTGLLLVTALCARNVRGAGLGVVVDPVAMAEEA
jgi:MFS family permease